MSHLKSFILFSSLFCLLANPSLQARCRDRSLEADYIVVGVGTAGAVVAKKLSDDRRASVIALHVGENLTEDPLIKFSADAAITVPYLLVGPPLYQNGETVPQPNADDRQLPWGIALPEGGASSINAGAYCRGTNEFSEKWEAIAGPNWSKDRLLALYKLLETYDGNSTNCAIRGCHGPLDVRQVEHPSQVSLKFTQATMEAARVPFVLDYNDPATPIGASSQLQYTQNGPGGELRVSSVNAFLNEKVVTSNGYGVDGRKLRILFNSTALKTIWDGNKAIGVEYLNDGEIKRVFAKKGVIVCAGLKSSFFLLHSGVGDRALLESFNIPVVFDNPNVGQHLVDQPGVRILFTSNPLDTPLIGGDPGLFAGISWLPHPHHPHSKIRELRFATINPIPGLTLATFDLCQERSRGSVSINSADPLAPPVIDLGEFTHPEDLFLFEEGFRTYVKRINEHVHAIDPEYELIFPDPAILDDPVLLREFIKENVGCNQHFQNHCRMAPFEHGGVVDSIGKVHGVENLFVADNSIVPNMDGSPMSTGYLAGANVALLIIEKDRETRDHAPCRRRR